VTIHIEATGFDARADEYERGRPGYPAAAVDYLAEVLRLSPGTTVVDLAAGTGKLTRQLVGSGANVIAVEPVAGMRRVLTQVVPEAEVLEGTAEELPLPDEYAQAVTVAQAFHWFQGHEALAEVHRVLRPSGRLGLVWNVRDLSQPLQAALEALMSRYRGSSPSQTSGEWRRAFETTALFGPLEQRSFTMAHVLDQDELVARALSTSFIARLPAGEQQRVSDEVASLCPDGSHIEMAYLTDVYWCQVMPK